MFLIKNGEIVELTDNAHIDAYKANGWTETQPEPLKKPTKSK